MTTEAATKIMIIGGGIGGLTLAQGLLKNNIPFQVFERDDSRSFRAQGYRIRLDGDAVHALKEVLPSHIWKRLEDSAAAEREISGITKIDSLSGEEDKRGPPPGPPGGANGPKGLHGARRTTERPIAFDRTIMREVLLSGLEEYVSYGKIFDRYEINRSCIVAHFADGSSYEGCFLVGADGVNSRVRKQYLPQLSIVDTTGRCIYGKTLLNPSLTSSLHPMTTKGVKLIHQRLPDGTPLTLFVEAMRFPNPEIVPIVNRQTGAKETVKNYLYWVLLSQEHVFKHTTADLTRLLPAQAAELSIEMTRHWHNTITPIFTQQSKDSASALRMVTALPDMPAWAPSNRLTVIGDAAHPMPPTAGLGAVSALKDVENLLIAFKEGISGSSIGKYEKNMREWASEAIRGSRSGGMKFFGQVEFSEAKLVD